MLRLNDLPWKRKGFSVVLEDDLVFSINAPLSNEQDTWIVKNTYAHLETIIVPKGTEIMLKKYETYGILAVEDKRYKY